MIIHNSITNSCPRVSQITSIEISYQYYSTVSGYTIIGNDGISADAVKLHVRNNGTSNEELNTIKIIFEYVKELMFSSEVVYSDHVSEYIHKKFKDGSTENIKTGVSNSITEMAAWFHSFNDNDHKSITDLSDERHDLIRKRRTNGKLDAKDSDRLEYIEWRQEKERKKRDDDYLRNQTHDSIE